MARVRPLGDPARPRFEVVLHPAAEKEFLDLPLNVQDRFDRAIDQARVDPFRPRPGVDITKLADLRPGEGLYRLRVGEFRSCYAVITASRTMWVLLFDIRGVGYGRMVKRATARLRGSPRG